MSHHINVNHTILFSLCIVCIYPGLDNRGKGLYYSGFLDCFWKILSKEGPLGFYKGWSASWFRLAPHTVLSLVFWDEARKLYKKIQASLNTK